MKPIRTEGAAPRELTQLAALDGLPPIQRPRAIDEGEVHIWYCFYDEIRDAELSDRYDALMNDEERARHRRFYFERDQRMFLVTRALVRTVLSRYADAEPAEWQFDTNAYGRPHVSGPVRGPFFNLSNTHGLVACAVARTERIGVDVEDVTRRTEPLEIADRFFSTSEVAALRRLDEGQHRTRFFSLWTLKEAYIKARGMGLSIPLGQFSYDLEQAPITITFGPQIDDVAEGWRFALTRASSSHFLSVAVDDPTARLRASRCIPLVTP